jgi:hypothetical protein
VCAFDFDPEVLATTVRAAAGAARFPLLSQGPFIENPTDEDYANAA